MKSRIIVLVTCASFLLCSSVMSQEFESLFDGETLRGWEGNLKMFRIQDGAIVAGTLEQPIANNEFLCTKQSFGDFELRLKVKAIGEGVNAGIQFRTRRIPNHHEVIGYQADVGGMWWGKLYDESRRRKIQVARSSRDLHCRWSARRS